MSSDLYDAGAKFELIMENIADKRRLIRYKNVENKKILSAVYILVRFM